MLQPATPAQARTAQDAVQDVMRGLCQSLPAYVWLAALSQLASRICHPNTIVQKTTRNIVGKVLQAYPHQVSICFLKATRRILYILKSRLQTMITGFQPDRVRQRSAATLLTVWA